MATQKILINAGTVKITPGEYSIKKHPRSNYPDDILMNPNDTPVYPTESLMDPCYGQMSQTKLGVALNPKTSMKLNDTNSDRQWFSFCIEINFSGTITSSINASMLLIPLYRPHSHPY